jgi:hypothetical protein
MVDMPEQVLIESSGYKFYVSRETAEQWLYYIGPLNYVGSIINLDSLTFDDEKDLAMKSIIDKQIKWLKNNPIYSSLLINSPVNNKMIPDSSTGMYHNVFGKVHGKINKNKNK